MRIDVASSLALGCSMQSVRLLALAATGCRAVLGIGEPPAPPDTGSGACATWHPDGFEPCSLPSVAPALALVDEVYLYDTSGDAGGTLYNAGHQAVLRSDQTLHQPDGTIAAVLVVDQLTTSGATRVNVVGPRPLVIISWSTIAIAGTIDAGSHLGIQDAPAHVAQIVQFGAGANQGCLASAGHDGDDAPLSGGSAGGGGGGQGATGGSGGSGGKGTAHGGAGGPAIAEIGLHAGCPGGTSGAAGGIARPPATTGSRALGGAGGGAIRLVARDSIDVTGSISASGAGGAGAPLHSACGGGGGGAGGYIGFEAPIVKLGGSIAANGGGGGGGGDSEVPGDDGADGAVGVQPAAGGAAASTGCGQPGGAGAAAAMLGGGAAGNSDACSGGGGGGGGASGVIVIKSPGYTPGPGTLSPAAQRQ